MSCQGLGDHASSTAAKYSNVATQRRCVTSDNNRATRYLNLRPHVRQELRIKSPELTAVDEASRRRRTTFTPKRSLPDLRILSWIAC